MNIPYCLVQGQFVLHSKFQPARATQQDLVSENQEFLEKCVFIIVKEKEIAYKRESALANKIEEKNDEICYEIYDQILDLTTAV